MRPKSSKSTGPTYHDSETCEGVDLTTYRQLTLFAEDSLASLIVLPGSDEARKMTVTSGRNIAESLPNSGPLGLLVKMCLVSERPFSTMCYLIWKIWTTPQGRLLYRLAPSMPRTGGSGYLLWPTPRANERQQRNSQDNHMALSKAVQLWPTPTATCWKNRETSNQKAELQKTIRGPLNPLWVEWLMGFPAGWTDLDVSETP